MSFEENVNVAVEETTQNPADVAAAAVAAAGGNAVPVSAPPKQDAPAPSEQASTEQVVTNHEPVAAAEVVKSELTTDGNQLRSVLRTILKCTHQLGMIQMVKVVNGHQEKTGENTLTCFTKEPNSSVIINGHINSGTPLEGFEGELGMGDLRLLQWILSADWLNDEGSTLSVMQETNKDGEKYNAGLKFVGKDGSTQQFRSLHSSIITRHLKSFKLKDLPFNLEFTPTIERIQRLSSGSASMKDYENSVCFEVKNGNLIADLGTDSGSHSLSLVFAENVEGTLSKRYRYSINHLDAILRLASSAEDYKMKIYVGDTDSAIVVVINTGLMTFEYALTPLA